jgi:hypothetical protein
MTNAIPLLEQTSLSANSATTTIPIPGLVILHESDVEVQPTEETEPLNNK